MESIQQRAPEARAEHRRRLDAIGEISAGIAHELRNPVLGIASAAQLLRFRAREDPVVEKNVGRILREVERLNRTVSALLEYGRTEPLRLAPGDPDAVWDEVVEESRGGLESRSLHLVRTRPPRPATCRIDADQLAKVFFALLDGAIEAAPPASDLALDSELLPDGGWRCRLRDAGPAIPADLLPRVFEPFVPARQGSTGIGLALCERIVEEHRGTIDVESAPGGTTVTVALPAS